MSTAINLLKNATAAGSAGTAENFKNNSNVSYVAIQAVGSTTSGAGSATIVIQVSNDGVNFIDHDTIALTLSTTNASAGVVISNEPWIYVRAYLSAISGTGASVSVIAGV